MIGASGHITIIVKGSNYLEWGDQLDRVAGLCEPAITLVRRVRPHDAGKRQHELPVMFEFDLSPVALTFLIPRENEAESRNEYRYGSSDYRDGNSSFHLANCCMAAIDLYMAA